jgi:hypothetical protein
VSFLVSSQFTGKGLPYSGILLFFWYFSEQIADIEQIQLDLPFRFILVCCLVLVLDVLLIS